MCKPLHPVEEEKMMIRILLLIAFFGHVLCWYCDCLITYTPNGRFSAKQLNDNEKLSELLEGMPLKRPMCSIVLGILALIMSFCGFLALCEWMRQFSNVYAAIMIIGAVLFITCVIPHHAICGLVEWFYIRLGCTENARKIILDFFKKTSATMIVCYIGLLIFAVTFFIAVITGTTSLPRWACIFNTLPLFFIISLFRIAGGGNIANAVMFIALFIIT